MDKGKIIERIRKLLALSKDKGASEDEAKTAAGMARRLMNKYDLSLSEIDIKKSDVIISEVATESWYPRFWTTTLATAVGQAFDCKSFRRGPVFMFFGLEADTQVASYLFIYLYRTILDLLDKKRKHIRRERKLNKRLNRLYSPVPLGDMRRYMRSYAQGIVLALHIRMQEERKKREKGFEAKGTGKDLVVLKGAIVEKAYKNEMKDVKRTYYNPKKFNMYAYEDGLRDGGDIQIHEGLKEGQDEVSSLQRKS